jgi:uncharacterized membrane protein YidH (DUF202 family)
MMNVVECNGLFGDDNHNSIDDAKQLLLLVLVVVAVVRAATEADVHHNSDHLYRRHRQFRLLMTVLYHIAVHGAVVLLVFVG